MYKKYRCGKKNVENLNHTHTHTCSRKFSGFFDILVFTQRNKFISPNSLVLQFLFHSPLCYPPCFYNLHTYLAPFSFLSSWCFISTDAKPDDFFECVQKLLNERKIFCTVDNAYEAVETLEDVGDQPDAEWANSAGVFDDELDDLDSHVPITKTLVDIFCELMPDNNNLLVQESTVRTFLTLLGGISEKKLNELGESVVRSVNAYVGAVPDNLRRNTAAMTCDEYVDAVLSSIPQAFKIVPGAGVASSMVKRLVSSFQSSRINEDIVVQVLELFSSLLVDAASNLSPTYSA